MHLPELAFPMVLLVETAEENQTEVLGVAVPQPGVAVAVVVTPVVVAEYGHPGGADWGHGGGGGGSFNSGIDQNNTSGVNIGHGKIIITFLGNENAAPVISQGTGPVSKVISEDTFIILSPSELNATDADTNASQLSWSILTSPSHGSAIADGNGTSPQTFIYQPNANYHGSDSFSVMVSDGDKNDSITFNLTINQINDSTVISGDLNSTINTGTIASGDINASP